MNSKDNLLQRSAIYFSKLFSEIQQILFFDTPGENKYPICFPLMAEYMQVINFISKPFPALNDFNIYNKPQQKISGIPIIDLFKDQFKILEDI